MFYQLASMEWGGFLFWEPSEDVVLRAWAAMFTALAFLLLFGSSAVCALRAWQGRGQPIRSCGPQSHTSTKQGTPSMGGLIILAGMAAAMLLWGNLGNLHVQCVSFVALGYGAVGFCDDYLKIVFFSEKGLSGKTRLLLEAVIAFLAVCVLLLAGPGLSDMAVVFPLFGGWDLSLSWFFPFFAAFVIVGTGNAVNLTDGLDGLAVVPIIVTAATLGLIAYLAGDLAHSSFFSLPYVSGAEELLVLCGAAVGAGLGFLWFNAPPASIFMGDTGSLALGGMLGAIAVTSRSEILLVVIGGLFVLEALSVIIQVLSFKLRGKRVFRMAPFHHHFEQKGWPESTVVVRFWIVSVILAMVGLAFLMLS